MRATKDFSNREALSLHEHSGRTRVNPSRMSVIIRNVGVMSSEVQIREMQRTIEKLNMSMATLVGERRVPTVGEFAQEFITEELASTEHRESTKRAKEYQVRRNIIPAFGKLPMDGLGNIQWNAWIKETKANPRDWRITRYFNVRKLLTELFHKAKVRGIIENVPKLDNPDEHRNTGRVITDRETWWILRNTTYRIFRVFFYGLYKQGVRPREMLRWERSMIKTAPDGRMWVEVPARITKTARSRLMPVNQTLAKHICRIMKENPDSRFVFQNRIHPDAPQLSYHGAFRTALMKARKAHPEMKPCVPYDWRRSFITRAMIAGKQPVYIAKLLDTSVPMLERVYTKDDAATMEALVE
jgi:hypothetical protein